MELSKDTVLSQEQATVCSKPSQMIPDLQESFIPRVSHLSNKEFLEEYASKQPEHYEEFYSHRVTEVCKSFNTLSTFTYTDCRDALISLCEAHISSLDINAVRYIEDKKLSKNGRIRIPRAADVFEGITIACLKPSDIDSVTLFSAIPVPESAGDEKFKMYFPSDDKRPHVKHYIPIKTIKNPQASFVTFFDNPILLVCEMFTDLSIQVVFKKSYLERNDPSLIIDRCVKMNYALLDQDIRRRIVQTYSHDAI
jgi:hypothetical protein